MQRMSFGSITVDALVDGELEIPAAFMLAGVEESELAQFAPISGGILRAPLTTFVVRAAGRVILVDTGIGPTLGSMAGRVEGTAGQLPGALSAAGIANDAVDTVVMTHVHSDHIGWNTVDDGGQLRPTFPNARYVVTRKEWAAREHVAGDAAPKSLAPLEKAGQLELVDDGYEVAAGVTLLPTPGHTPGHTSVVVLEAGQGAIITGDAVHHPIELERPEIVVPIDTDRAQSTASRLTILARAEAEGLVVMGGHFPPPTAGRMVRVEQKLRWRWLGAEVAAG